MAEVKITEHSGESVYIRTQPVTHALMAWHIHDFATALVVEGAPDDTLIEFTRSENFHLTSLSCRFHRTKSSPGQIRVSAGYTHTHDR